MSAAIASRPWTSRAGRRLPFSALGFGAAPLGNMYRRLEDRDAEAAVQRAWDLGMRYFDTAPLYGHGLSEMRLGAVLRGAPRDDYVLSTKVGRLIEPCTPGEEDGGIFRDVDGRRIGFDYSYDGVMRSFEESLARLGLDRVDILFVHDIDPVTHGSAMASEARFTELIAGGGWRALDELRRTGAVSAIGAGLNVWQSCERLMAVADPDLFLLAGRYTLLEQPALDSFLPACLARGIGVVVGGAFNSGVLATGPVEGALYDYAPAPAAVLERARALQAVCARHDVTLAQAALSFPTAHPAVVSVLVGAQTAGEVERNVATFALAPPPALWRELKTAGLIHADAPTPELSPAC